MTSRDGRHQKIKRLRELRRLLLTYREVNGYRPPKEDLVKLIEMQIAWLEHGLLKEIPRENQYRSVKAF